MKSIVKLEVAAPLEKVAELLADPANMTKWMDDLERVEPLSGEPGMPGSTFRMVGKAGGPQSNFVVTVTARTLPEILGLKLQSPSVDVAIADTFTACPRAERSSCPKKCSASTVCSTRSSAS